MIRLDGRTAVLIALRGGAMHAKRMVDGLAAQGIDASPTVIYTSLSRLYLQGLVVRTTIENPRQTRGPRVLQYRLSAAGEAAATAAVATLLRFTAPPVDADTRPGEGL